MRRDIVAAARRWIGTPYRHQASCRGAGADCLGLIRGVWRDVIGAEPCSVPPYTAEWSETGKVEALLEASQLYLRERQAGCPNPGDVILFRMKSDSVAKHLAIAGEIAPRPTFIHAYSGFGVVENTLTQPWRKRIVATFEFPRGSC